MTWFRIPPYVGLDVSTLADDGPVYLDLAVDTTSVRDVDPGTLYRSTRPAWADLIDLPPRRVTLGDGVTVADLHGVVSELPPPRSDAWSRMVVDEDGTITDQGYVPRVSRKFQPGDRITAADLQPIVSEPNVVLRGVIDGECWETPA